METGQKRFDCNLPNLCYFGVTGDSKSKCEGMTQDDVEQGDADAAEALEQLQKKKGKIFG